MPDLTKERCIACTPASPHVTEGEMLSLRPSVPEWRVVTEGSAKALWRSFRFRGFSDALAFANEVGRIAEEQGHHPVMTIELRKVTVVWTTQAIHNLHRNDFIMAAKTDQLHAGRSSGAAR
ncbi:MAG: 4a-hydroxytetrahydrobiopterin dehydratase [SAR202 cluster bacterium]|nr:4a-hydroxytetrahydrobiopterin dehydratase [SAR202 cluster bacterium]